MLEFNFQSIEERQRRLAQEFYTTQCESSVFTTVGYGGIASVILLLLFTLATPVL